MSHIPFLERLKRVFVLGGGRTGYALSRWLHARHVQVYGWDDHHAIRSVWHQQNVEIVDPLNTPSWRWADVDGIIVSPGIPHLWPRPHPVVHRALQAGVPLISELDLWMQAQPPHIRIVGITGTNGKSTTTALIHHILSSQGLSVACGGNIGIPVCDLPQKEIYVLELSSYQLERMQCLSVDVGVLLNITPDHLDRHGGMAGYIAAKQKLFVPNIRPQTFIIGTDTEPTQTIHTWLSTAVQPPHRLVSVQVNQKPLPFSSRPPSLGGDHNLQNALCAYEAARAFDLGHEHIMAAMRTFPGLEHRQEVVVKQGNAVWVNDSKATNVVSVCTAFACFDRIFWIAGGRPKLESLEPLLAFRQRVQQTFLIGEAAIPWAAFFEQNNWPFIMCGTLDQAVEVVWQISRDEEQSHTVLLSPGCASFDQFTHFEARGQAFKKLVLERTSGHP